MHIYIYTFIVYVYMMHTFNQYIYRYTVYVCFFFVIGSRTW